MTTLQLIYVNATFHTMIGFEVEISTDSKTDELKYDAVKEISDLLRKTKPLIQAFGDAVKVPSELVEYMSEEELDYFLLLLHKDVDELIENHIFVRVPTEHAIPFQRIEDQTIWRLNGIGVSEAILANKNEENRVFINTVALNELRDNYVAYSMSKSHA